MLPLPIWWLLPAVLLGSTAFLGASLHQANQKINALATQHDTLIQSHVVMETDTIYITKTVYQDRIVYLPSQPINATASGNVPPPASKNNNIESVGNQLVAVNNSLSKSSSSDMQAAPNATASSHTSLENIANRKLALLKLTHNKPSPIDLDIAMPLPPKKTFGQQLERVIYQIQPKSFELGPSVGYINPLGTSIRKGSGFSTGLRASTAFSRHLKLWGDVNYNNLYFVSNIMDEAIGVPVITAPGDNLTFDEAIVTQPSLQYNVGLQYNFGRNRNLAPFIGLGIGATSLLHYTIKYEFQGQTGTNDIIVDSEVFQRDFVSGFIPIQAGLEGRLSNRLYWQATTMYRFSPFQTEGLKAPDIFGISGAIMYKF